MVDSPCVPSRPPFFIGVILRFFPLRADGFITDLKRKFQQGDIVLRLVYVMEGTVRLSLFQINAGKVKFTLCDGDRIIFY